MLTPTDMSQMGINEMAVILMSLGGTGEFRSVRIVFCRNRFCDAAVDVSFERGFVVDYATGLEH